MDKVAIRVTKAFHGVGTEELAARAGVSRFQVWRWQTGRPGVAPATAARIERTLLSGNGTRSASGNEAA